MATPNKPVDDGYITGTVECRLNSCGYCNLRVVCVTVTSINLPKSIKPGPTLIAYHGDKPREFLGIGCGCYARFHRQIAHIRHS